jgi:hypothetical protein
MVSQIAHRSEITAHRPTLGQGYSDLRDDVWIFSGVYATDSKARHVLGDVEVTNSGTEPGWFRALAGSTKTTTSAAAFRIRDASATSRVEAEPATVELHGKEASGRRP